MKSFLTAIVLGLVGTAALAADDKTGWNAGIAASFGQYTFDTKQLDDSSVGVKLFGGYRFNKWLGLEGAYYNFGDFSTDLDPPNPGGAATAKIDGFSGSALIYAPLNSQDFEAYGKLGYYFFDQQVVVDDAVAGGNKPEGITLGAGARFFVSDQFAVRAEGDWFNIKDGDLWAINLGFEYLFGRPAKAVPVAIAAPVAVVAPAPLPPPAPGQ